MSVERRKLVDEHPHPGPMPEKPEKQKLCQCSKETQVRSGLKCGTCDLPFSESPEFLGKVSAYNRYVYKLRMNSLAKAADGMVMDEDMKPGDLAIYIMATMILDGQIASKPESTIFDLFGIF